MPAYALPTATFLGSNLGWSNTSGGPERGYGPSAYSSGEQIIFDANSGPSRDIAVGSGTIYGISTVGANPMTFVGTQEVTVMSANVNLAGSVSWQPPMRVYGAANLRCKGTPLLGLIQLMDVSGYSVSIEEDLVCAGISIYPYASEICSIVAKNGANVTMPRLNLSANTITNLGSGTWTFTADSGTLLSGGSIHGETATVKLTGGGAATKSLGGISAPQSVSVWNATTGEGGLTLYSSLTLNKFRASTGSKTILQQGTTLTASVFEVEGAGLPLYIQSTSAVRANIAKAGGGTAEFKYAHIKDISFSPVNTFFGSLGKDLGNNVGITFRSGAATFFPFF